LAGPHRVVKKRGPMRSRTLLFITALAVTLASAPRAYADATPQDQALADVLYKEGIKLAHEGRWLEAKQKLEASLALDPGAGTLWNLSRFEERLGNMASAWSRANDAAALARTRGNKLAKDMEADAKRLEPTLARLVLTVAPESRAAGVTIKRDGTVIQAAAWDTPIPLDPGEHKIEATAPGKRTWTTTVKIEVQPSTTTVAEPYGLTWMPKTGGTPETITGAAFTGEAIVSDGASLFWVDGTDVMTIPILGSTPSGSPGPRAEGSSPVALASDGINVYWTDSAAVMKVAISGGMPVQLAPAAMGDPYGIAVDTTHVYWTNRVSGTVMKVPIAGGTAVPLASQQNLPAGIAVDPSNVYWTNSTAGTVVTVPIAGGTPIILASQLANPQGIAVDASSVYWADPTAGTIMKVAK
jgi:hypothetical protein